MSRTYPITPHPIYYVFCHHYFIAADQEYTKQFVLLEILDCSNGQAFDACAAMEVLVIVN